jgi:hypothetical protein
MKLQLENLKKYNRFIKGIASNVNQFYESIYMNFAEKTAYFYNETCQGRVKFDYEGDPVTNFFVKESLFSNIININSELDYEKNRFKIGKDIFEVPRFGDNENNIEEFPKRNFDNFDGKLNINFTSNLLSIIKRTMPIMPLHDNNKKSLQGIFIRDNKLIVTDRFRFLDLTLKDTIDNIELSHNVLKFINLLEGNEKVDIYVKNGVYKIVIDEVLELLISSPINLSLGGSNGVEPDIKSFRASIVKDYVIDLNKSDFRDGINILKVFASNISKDEVTIEINTDSMSVIINDTVNKIYSKKDILCTKVSPELVGTSFVTCFSFITELINTFPVEKYTFAIDINPESRTINVFDTNDMESCVTIKRI